MTKNISFDKDGYLKLSHGVRALTSENISATFDMPMAIVREDDYGYFVASYDEAFQVDATAVFCKPPTQITTTDVIDPALQSDAKYFNGLFAVTGDTDVRYYDDATNTWTITNLSLSSIVHAQHPICVMPNQAAVAIANVYDVKLYSSPLTATPTLLRTLTILSDYYITSMCYFNQNLYIGTMNRYGGRALLYVWNGNGTAAQAAYEIESNHIMDVCVHKDSVWLVSGSGALLRFNGTGFSIMGTFPVYHTERFVSEEANITMYKNCLKSNGDTLYINFSDERNAVRMLDMPDGVWAYDDGIGLYHRYADSTSPAVYDIAVNQVDVNTTTDVITVNAAPDTGTECLFHTFSTPIGGLKVGGKYYVIKTGATTIKLAKSLTDAQAGTAIDLTTTGSDNSSLTFFPQFDYGQFYGSRHGAIGLIERSMQWPNMGIDLMFGYEAKDRDMGTHGYISAVSPALTSVGYFVTPKIFSENITDTYNLLTIKYGKFVEPDDKIIIKYRTEDDERNTIVESSDRWRATWTSTTTFTTPEMDMEYAEVGDEVEILMGAAGGHIAHISDISETGGTYTVTIDEEYPAYTTGDKSSFVFRNWKMFDTISGTDADADLGYYAKELGVTGKFIQLKIILKGVGVTIENLSIDNKYNLPARK